LKRKRKKKTEKKKISQVGKSHHKEKKLVTMEELYSSFFAHVLA